MSELTSSAQTVGLTMAPRPCIVHFFDNRKQENLQGVFESMHREQPNLELIIAILGKKGDASPGYSELPH